MGRKKKYEDGSQSVTVRYPIEILDAVTRKAKMLGMERSEYLVGLAELASQDDTEFCALQARKHLSKYHYWKSRAADMKESPELFDILAPNKRNKIPLKIKEREDGKFCFIHQNGNPTSLPNFITEGLAFRYAQKYKHNSKFLTGESPE